MVRALAAPFTTAQARRLRRRRPSFREWPAKHELCFNRRTVCGQIAAIPLNIHVHDFFSCFCPWNWGTRMRVDTAPKASGCFLGGTQEIFGAVSEDLLGGTGKAEDAKLPGAGIIPKLCPEK